VLQCVPPSGEARMQVQEGSFCTADNESMGPLLAMLSLLDDPCFIQTGASNPGLKEVGGRGESRGEQLL
jgi:hypothetical protein